MPQSIPPIRAIAVAGAVLGLVLAVGPARAEMTVPYAVDPGQSVTVEFAPPAGDSARLVVQPIAGPAGGERPAAPARVLAPVAAGTERMRVEAPVKSGSYWLELHEGGRRRERAPLDVVAAPVGLSAPVEVPPTEPFEIRLSLGGAPSVRLRMTGPDGSVLWERVVMAEQLTGGVLAIPAPDLSGRYRLAMIHPEAGEPSAAVGFSVDATRAWLRAPSVIPAGAPVAIDRFGPGGPDHALEILSATTGAMVVERSLAGSEGARGTVVLAGPGRAGRYRLRYVSRASGEVLSNVPLIVTDQ